MSRSVGSTVYRTKRHFVLGNLEVALSEAPRRGAERKLSGKQEALLVATACSKPPEGRKRWTLDLLAGAIVKLTDHAELSRETGAQTAGGERPQALATGYVASRRACPREGGGGWRLCRPDGGCAGPLRRNARSAASVSVLRREPDPGKPEHYDCEYSRKGTANLFVFLDAHRSWRAVKVTEQRTAADFATDSKLLHRGVRALANRRGGCSQRLAEGNARQALQSRLASLVSRYMPGCVRSNQPYTLRSRQALACAAALRAGPGRPRDLRAVAPDAGRILPEGRQVYYYPN